MRLLAPTGGATLSAPAMTSAYLADPGATATLGFDRGAIAVTERGFGRAIATVRRVGSARRCGLGRLGVSAAATRRPASDFAPAPPAAT